VYSFEKLEIWQLSLDLVEKIYQVSGTLPEDEKFGLVSQLKRASVSVTLNITEGRGPDSDAEFRRFLGIALKSLLEIIACIKIYQRLRFLDEATVSNICGFCDKIDAKIRKFRNALSTRHNTQRTRSAKRKASSVK
jgi:four helix bundle protein